MNDDPRDWTDAEWRARLTPDQYRILREGATERAFTGPHLDDEGPGRFLCAGCGAALFDAAKKYDSGSGWPSFSAPADPGAIALRRDASHGMVREEAVCARCEGHLGHVFPDGPAEDGGLRFCINGHALVKDGR